MQRLQLIISQFAFHGHYLGAQVNTEGHINDTFILCFRYKERTVRYVLQRINSTVFPDPVLVMENIQAVTAHLQAKIAASGGDPTRESLRLVPTISGDAFYHSPQGDYWRAYDFIEGARSYEIVEKPRHFHESGRTFGQFQYLLSDFPADSLHETIPHFHDTDKRFQDFLGAVQADPVDRAHSVQREIAAIMQRGADTGVIVDLMDKGDIPIRVTHNDTKLSNIMIDDLTGRGLCVLDLDTVMPGSALYDFADAIRFGASTAKEDEANLDLVSLDLDLFSHFARGYLAVAKKFLYPAEIEYLAFSTRLITLEQAMRFLEDYLNGDIYYKVEYSTQNLARARTQLKLVADMETKMSEMEAILAAILQEK